MLFKDLKTNNIKKKYAIKEFPNIMRLLVGDIIRDCQAKKFDMLRDVKEAIRKLQ